MNVCNPCIERIQNEEDNSYIAVWDYKKSLLSQQPFAACDVCHNKRILIPGNFIRKPKPRIET